MTYGRARQTISRQEVSRRVGEKNVEVRRPGYYSAWDAFLSVLDCCEAYGKRVTVERSIEALERKRRRNHRGVGGLFTQGTSTCGEPAKGQCRTLSSLLAERVVVGTTRIHSNCAVPSNGVCHLKRVFLLLTLRRRDEYIKPTRKNTERDSWRISCLV